MRALQRELDDLRSSQAARDRDRGGDRDELARLRREAREADDTIGELRAEVSGLIAELRSLSGRHSDLVGERERDAESAQQLQTQLNTFKRKYESAKTELRSLKGPSVA